MGLIISIIAGMLGGTGVGGILKKLSTGKLGNLAAGGIGGLLGGLGGSVGDILGQLTGNPTADAAVGGAASGGVLAMLFGLVKNYLLKK